MKISHVTLNNFKPYYGDVSMPLSTSKDKNVILIGGRNGQGKTSFLVGVVWCLYGANISIIDKVFKDEVKGNYTKFLSKALNKRAYDEGNTKFSVEVGLEEVELSEAFTKKEQKLANIVLKRSYDVSDPTVKESFEILMDGEPNNLLSDDSDKANFVNDYLIPVELAKFVFFDAEKIAEIAQLGPKDQANLMDKAFGQVLGLSTYENLIGDLQQYEEQLQKQDASGKLSIEISVAENAIRANEIRCNDIENELNEIEERIEELRGDITDLTNQLIRRGDTSIKIDMNELRKREEDLNEQQVVAARKFNEVAELIPLAIIAHKLEETNEHIQKEEDAKLNEIERKALSEKTKEFAELLFNKPPLPEYDIDMDQKHFYYTKTKNLLAELYKPKQDGTQLDFSHDLDKSDIKHINEVFALVKSYSKDVFENIFNEYMRAQNDYKEVLKELKQAEASSKDEFIQEIQDKKNGAEREKTKLEKKSGALSNEKIKLEREINSFKTNISKKLDRVKVSKKAEEKIKVVRKYIK